MELVEIKNAYILCDSHLVSRKFGQKHKEVVKRIKKLESDIDNLRGDLKPPLPFQEEREYRGTKYTAYLMQKEFFSLLVMRFKGDTAFEWQVKFNKAFYEMEDRLKKLEKNPSDLEWLTHRTQGKISRKEETDVIKEFVEYATNQGSKSAKFYYKHITNATYKALGMIVQKKPKLRDTMDLYEISELMLAERVAKNSIKKYMDLGRNYKDIYESVKEDLVSFSSGLKIVDNSIKQQEK